LRLALTESGKDYKGKNYSFSIIALTSSKSLSVTGGVKLHERERMGNLYR
jgi:hypothetical protein